MGNILVIGDLHEPFCLDEYLFFNKWLYKKHKCNRVIFIGDIIDGHSWSYHEPNQDGMSPGEELSFTIKRLKRWYKVFPKADVLLGNHDMLIHRKAKTHKLPSGAIRPFREMIKAPDGWNFHLSLKIDGVMYVHGSTGTAIQRAMMSRMSTVQGHLHSRSFVEWSVSEKDKIFGLQVGCGIDRHAYAFEYGKDMVKKPVISSGVLLDNGRLPIIELADL